MRQAWFHSAVEPGAVTAQILLPLPDCRLPARLTATALPALPPPTCLPAHLPPCLQSLGIPIEHVFANNILFDVSWGL